MSNFKNNNRSGRNNNRNDRPRNEIFTFPLPEVILSKSGNIMDENQIYGVFSDLEENGTFKVVSIPVQITRALYTGDEDKKGFMNVGYIHSIDVEKHEANIMIYANYVEGISALIENGGLSFSPRIIADRNGDFSLFTNFDLI